MRISFQFVERSILLEGADWEGADWQVGSAEQC